MLEIGKTLPDMDFVDQNGEAINTDSFKGKKLIYLFYRGNWCPLCMAQIKEISEQYREINELGVEVLLISPQPHRFTVNLAKKMNVPFKFLTDDKGKMAKQLGLFVKGGTPLGMELLGYKSDTVLPTVIITDESGKIIYTDQTDNYRVRPEPETFLEVIKAG
jgi:peroxiredoxin